MHVGRSGTLPVVVTEPQVFGRVLGGTLSVISNTKLKREVIKR
jgi:hypothetical protein